LEGHKTDCHIYSSQIFEFGPLNFASGEVWRVTEATFCVKKMAARGSSSGINNMPEENGNKWGTAL
jgi:hypothetical protein